MVGRPGDTSALSPEARRHLEQELDDLRRRQAELDEIIARTDAVEDRGDQAQRLALADELARIAERIRELTEVLAGRAAPSSTDALPEGTEVTIRFGDGSTETMRVVSIPVDADNEAETVTRASPLGQALVGAHAGDTITYAGPEGPIVAEVIAIRLPSQ